MIAMMKTDADIIQDVLQGQSESFELIVNRYHDRLLAAVRKVVACPMDADDVVQDAFINGYLHLSRFRGQSSLLTWLYRIAMNLAISHQRKTRRALSWDACSTGDSYYPDDHSSSPDEELLRQERSEELHIALERLQPHYRDVLLLREIEGYHYKTIARMLGIPVGVVRSRLHRARLKLRDMLQHTHAA